MDILKKLDLKNISIPKAIGIFVIFLIVFVVATSLIGLAMRTVFNANQYESGSSSGSYGAPAIYYEDEAAFDYGERSLKTSSLSFIPPWPGYGYSTGSDAERFEITEYNGNVKTPDLEGVCDKIEDLKLFEYVVFENANRNERNCNYMFKVANKEVDGVLETIKSLKPESLNENTHTIKPIVEGYTSEIEILEKKLSSIEETLIDAKEAYDEVEIIATRAQDVESLANIIDSKISLIERLTNERIDIKERIDRLNKQTADQLDRLNFTFFSIFVAEDKLIDLKGMKESWKFELKRFVSDLNEVLQKITIDLVRFILQLAWMALYLVLAILVMKYGWRGAKYMWKR